MYHYPPEFIESLAGLGLAPTDTTPPLSVRDAVNDLYRYELRKLRDQLKAGDFEKPDYVPQVIVLRRKYWLLTLPKSAWEQICAIPPRATDEVG